MLTKSITQIRSVPRHVAVMLALVGITLASGAFLLLKHTEPKAEAMTPPRAARLERVDGNVSIAQTLAPSGTQNDAAGDPQSGDQLAWRDASLNAPVTVGDRILARENSHAAIAFSGRNYARLNPDTTLDVLSLADRRTQLALRGGSSVFDVGELSNGELFEIATPNGAVDLMKPGLYEITLADGGDATVSVLSGLAQVVSPGGTSDIKEGESLTLAGLADATAAPPNAGPALRSKLAPAAAGQVLDDYYRYRYPKVYDGRYRSYDAYLSDPYSYEPYGNSTSYQYLSEDIPGLYDLDQYGDWQDVTGYGRCWVPRVATDWAPYRDGAWDVDDVWGATWVSNEPWGYAPYHYGRWAYVNQQRWAWVPEGCTSHPVYAPALVAFVPVQQSRIAWVPLGPGEPFVPRYYDGRFEPRYFGSTQVVRSCVNLNYPAAVTVVPVQAFAGPINSRVVVPASPQWFGRTRPVMDPFAVEGLRQVAQQQERAQRREARRDLQAASFNNHPVVTSVAPIMPPVRANAAQALGFQSVPENRKNAKLQVENSGQLAVVQRPNGVPNGAQPTPQETAAQRDQRIAELKSRVQHGDTSATQELQTLKRERREQPPVVRSPPPQGQQTAEQQKQQRRLERQQQAVQQQKAPAQATTQATAQQAQVNQQRKAQKQIERQQIGQRQDQQQQQVRRQQKEQVRQQRAQQAAAQQAQADQQRQQRKAQRNVERPPQIQQPQRQVPQANPQRDVMKAQRQAERQQQQQQIIQQRAVQRANQQQGEQNRALHQQQKQEQRQQLQPPAPRPPVSSGAPTREMNREMNRAEQKAPRKPGRQDR